MVFAARARRWGRHLGKKSGWRAGALPSSRRPRPMSIDPYLRTVIAAGGLTPPRLELTTIGVAGGMAGPRAPTRGQVEMAPPGVGDGVPPAGGAAGGAGALRGGRR